MSKPNPRNANGARRRAVRARVLARDEACWLCRRLVDKTLPAGHRAAPEVHELIPVAQGGDPLDIHNCVLTHRACNQWIGNRTPDQLARAGRAPRAVGERRTGPRPVITSRDWGTRRPSRG